MYILCGVKGLPPLCLIFLPRIFFPLGGGGMISVPWVIMLIIINALGNKIKGFSSQRVELIIAFGFNAHLNRYEIRRGKSGACTHILKKMVRYCLFFMVVL